MRTSASVDVVGTPRISYGELSLCFVAAKKGFYNGSVTLNGPTAGTTLLLETVQVGDNQNYVFTDAQTCGACHQATELVRPTGKLPEPPTEATEPGSHTDDDRGTPWWKFFSRTLLHPAAAAAYLVLLMVLVPLALRDPAVVSPVAEPAPASILGPAARLFVSARISAYMGGGAPTRGRPTGGHQQERREQ